MIYEATYVGQGLLTNGKRYRIALADERGGILVKVAPDYRKVTQHPSVLSLLDNWRNITPV